MANLVLAWFGHSLYPAPMCIPCCLHESMKLFYVREENSEAIYFLNRKYHDNLP